MKDFLLYLMAFSGLLIMFMSFIKMLIITKSKEKKSKSKFIKLAIVGLFIFTLSRILHGQLL